MMKTKKMKMTMMKTKKVTMTMIATGVKSLLTGTGFDWVLWCKPALLALACHCHQ